MSEGKYRDASDHSNVTVVEGENARKTSIAEDPKEVQQLCKDRVVSSRISIGA